MIKLSWVPVMIGMVAFVASGTAAAYSACVLGKCGSDFAAYCSANVSSTYNLVGDAVSSARAKNWSENWIHASNTSSCWGISQTGNNVPEATTSRMKPDQCPSTLVVPTHGGTLQLKYRNYGGPATDDGGCLYD